MLYPSARKRSQWILDWSNLYFYTSIGFCAIACHCSTSVSKWHWNLPKDRTPPIAIVATDTQRRVASVRLPPNGHCCLSLPTKKLYNNAMIAMYKMSFTSFTCISYDPWFTRCSPYPPLPPAFVSVERTRAGNRRSPAQGLPVRAPRRLRCLGPVTPTGLGAQTGGDLEMKDAWYDHPMGAQWIY